ncbi:TonB family protein [Hymenobacter taeanensis]|uniref:TonB family protein n=3 Tax=Hymenobacter TaxID=89966 RepID=A0A6M6BJH5_9BACT|nr:TonB family protein [Hymenobacter taeanensis]
MQQDSMRAALFWSKTPLLKRGIGQRFERKQLIPEDNTYFSYIARMISFPVEAMRAMTEGTVTMRLTIDAAGRVVDSKLVESTIPTGAAGEASMVQQAQCVLRQVRFEPSTGGSEEVLRVSYAVN